MARLIFFGTEDFSAISLQALIDAEYEIAAVVTKPDSKKGRGQKITQPQIKKIALANNIPVWQPDKLADIHDSIASLQPVTGVLVSYGKIIPQPIIELYIERQVREAISFSRFARRRGGLQAGAGSAD